MCRKYTVTKDLHKGLETFSSNPDLISPQRCNCFPCPLLITKERKANLDKKDLNAFSSNYPNERDLFH